MRKRQSFDISDEAAFWDIDVDADLLGDQPLRDIDVDAERRGDQPPAEERAEPRAPTRIRDTVRRLPRWVPAGIAGAVVLGAMAAVGGLHHGPSRHPALVAARTPSPANHRGSATVVSPDGGAAHHSRRHTARRSPQPQRRVRTHHRAAHRTPAHTAAQTSPTTMPVSIAPVPMRTPQQPTAAAAVSDEFGFER
jgi:hypothetical protein